VKLPSVRRVRGSARGRSAAGFSTATLSVKLDGPFKLLHSLPLHPPGTLQFVHAIALSERAHVVFAGKSTLNIAPEGRKPLSVLYHIGHRRGSKFICIRYLGHIYSLPRRIVVDVTAISLTMTTMTFAPSGLHSKSITTPSLPCAFWCSCRRRSMRSK
jgi:hypothetical protein